jgi:hypothetical protein
VIIRSKLLITALLNLVAFTLLVRASAGRKHLDAGKSRRRGP